MNKTYEESAERFKKLMEDTDFDEDSIAKMNLGEVDKEIATRMLMAKHILERKSVILLADSCAICCVDANDLDNILQGLDKGKVSLRKQLTKHIENLKGKHDL